MRERYDEADAWYRRALAIFERLGLERDAASDYHHLGIVAQRRERYDEAEGWFRRALAIFERLGHPPLRVQTLRAMGLLREYQNQLPDAVRWFGEGLAIAAEHDLGIRSRLIANLVRVRGSLGRNGFATAWREACGAEPPPELLDPPEDGGESTTSIRPRVK